MRCVSVTGKHERSRHDRSDVMRGPDKCHPLAPVMMDILLHVLSRQFQLKHFLK